LFTCTTHSAILLYNFTDEVKNLIEESIKLQLEAKAIGLDWIELDKIIDKIREETDELDEAIESKDREHIIEEFGDLFFSIISLSRHLNINMDNLINSANQKFKDRLSKINVEMKKRNIEYAEPAEMIEIWKSIKKQND
jgi:ATP diphosphatase